MKSRITATATVHVTVEVRLHQPWDASATFDLVHGQACNQAEQAIASALGSHESRVATAIGMVRVIGSTPAMVVLSNAIPVQPIPMPQGEPT